MFLKKSLLPVLCICSLIFACQTNHFEEEQKGVADDWFYAQRAYPSGQVDQKAYYQAVNDRLNQAQIRSGLDWEFEGPTNVGGRLTDVEMPVDDQNTIYVGAASGGVFKSENLGLSWESIFDDAASLSIGDIAISKNNTDLIIVGTGESNAGGSSLAYDGYGVYRSDDAGSSWTHLGLEDVGSIGRVAISPSSDEVLFVAAMGDLFGNNAERGVYRSVNGGMDWEQVLFVSDSTGFVDLAINPNNPDIIYAAAWERIRRVDYRQYGGATTGLYRSEDGGDTWEELTIGLPSASNEKGRIGIGMAASNPDVIYLHYAASDGFLRGVFKTSNGGDSWVEVSSAGIVVQPFMWWFGRIEVDPTDENRVFFVGFNNHESTDGGASWSPIFSGVHVDQHAIFIHPENPELVLNGNDGGLYVSTTGGDQYEFRDNLPITQMYTLDFDPNQPQKLYSGTQDNGTNRTVTGGLGDWEKIFGGDGFHSLVDPNDSQTIFVEFQNGNLYRSNDGGQNFVQALGGITAADRRNWKMPYVFDPSNSNIMYLGANRIFKSTDQGDNWVPISPDLTNGPGTGNLKYGTITSISVSPLNVDVIYVGTDDGNMWVTADGGSNWENISNNLPDRWITRVLASSIDVNRVYVSFSGYRFGTDEGHIYQSNNQGADWTDWSNNLADIPVNDLSEGNNLTDLLAATDVGVYLFDENSQTWSALGTGMPQVVVTELAYVPDSELLYAGTYGRSAYSTDLQQLSTSNESASDDWVFYPTFVEDVLHLDAPVQLTKDYVVRLWSLEGRLLYQGTCADLLQMDFTSYPKGGLVVELLHKGKSIHTTRLIKL